MRRFSCLLLFKLTLVLALSSTVARAHEVVPTIADLSVADDTVTLSLQINLEAFLAGVDLDATEDTDESPLARDYDTLRALPAGELAKRAPQLLPGWNALPLLSVSDTSLALRTTSLTVPTDVDPELPRITQWVLTAPIVAGDTLRVAWPDGGGDLIVRQQGVDAPYTGLVSGGTADEITLSGGDAQNGWQAFASYIPVGFDHILPKGLDHILFVLGLFFLSTHLRPLIWQVSAFTLAHTVTLALGALGWVSVPGSIVEPLIAASIVFVAVENIFAHGLNPWRPVVIFAFGLLHGLGFASVLGDFGLPEDQFIPALLGFNVGVELGQLTVIAIAFALVFWAMRKSWYRAVIAIPASCVIAAIGGYWVVERTLL
ncbi:HupE/UreJ family protein [uncultured Sulfitobacter sp.]|uniref:HupE/UreJ family protein n=1 Tax=uncultured Sulfitobacter sp. TaxID=191468 RepID=UPI0026086C03|nr:HupE/UreJ family protein [uncultured Sulfitobacter sp.]